ncbi:Uncharacterized protein dnm_029860 [Desulfonema magnum]|uniref:Uncharacterized protein n=1 Tax=Desulfonema magnum TaxID=45655 RepID=A0A975BJQ6_9BACT|nr:Uncharacterized protein dnm_029860 [Desulfonema magnum]
MHTADIRPNILVFVRENTPELSEICLLFLVKFLCLKKLKFRSV